MKILAMYLPQFHEVKENSRWWGEGFTEWTTVKNARPLYEGHLQPVHPYKGAYYDLMDRRTMEWQSMLMERYGVDGMCIYHYWFRDGRQILERPAKNLLAWKDIDMPFCFSWANETWARTWHRDKDKNVWTSAFEKKEQDTDNGILLEQRYGKRQDWEKHFYHLLPFFRDERYIKVAGRPVFVFHRVSLIPCFENMIDCWKELAAREGLEGLYLIGNACKDGSMISLDEELVHEPASAIRSCMLKEGDVKTADYDEVWEEMLRGKPEKKKTYGGFVAYDTTPRHGSAGVVIQGAAPDKFQGYLTRLMAKNALSESQFTFINAWNEWGEGMYLEPDEEHGFEYLEAVAYAKQHYREHLAQIADSMPARRDGWQERYLQMYLANKKEIAFRDILDKWMTLRDKGILATSFLDKSIRTIAIYGYGLLGRHLLAEAGKSGHSVAYIIDRDRITDHLDIPHFFPDSPLPPADVVIVTTIHCYGEIYQSLRTKGIEDILSLEYLILESSGQEV